MYGGILLYSTLSGAIIYIPHENLDSQGGVNFSGLKKNSIDALVRTHMVFASDEAERVFVKTAYRQFMSIVNDVLYITVEITDACNLVCDYCYQEKFSKRRYIDECVIAKFLSLLRASALKSIKSLNVNFIGGEPFLLPRRVVQIWNQLCEFASERNYSISTKINTNGVLLDQETLSCFHNAEVVFPLGAPIDYRTIIRKQAERSGSLREMLKRKILELAPIFNANNDMTIVFRYNVNHNNTQYFKDYVDEIRSFGIYKSRIDVVNTNNNAHGCFHNELTDRQFWHWYLQDALPVLLQYKFQEPIQFRNQISRCKARRQYSFKLFADGRLGLCNGIPHSNSLPSIDDFNNLEMLNDYWAEIKGFDYMLTSRCDQCNKIFVCGGSAICHDLSCDTLDYKIETYVKRKYEIFNSSR